MVGQVRPELSPMAWWLAGALLAVLLLFLVVAGVPDARTAWVVVSMALAAAASVLAWTLRATRRRLAAHEQALIAWAEQRSAQQERLRIARELHDLASHGLGAITLRACAVRELPGPAGDLERTAALRDIEHASRDATLELRRMLQLLRDGETQAAPLAPQQTLADVPAVIATARSRGVRVDYAADSALSLSGGAQTTIVAAIAEGLDNVARHAGPTSATVRITRRGQGARLSIVDAGPAAEWQSQPGTGHGLRGLRERVAALGGAVTERPTATGFALIVDLPGEEGGSR